MNKKVTKSFRATPEQSNLIDELCIELNCGVGDLCLNSILELHKDFKSKIKDKVVEQMQDKEYRGESATIKEEKYQEHLPINTLRSMIIEGSHTKFISGDIFWKNIEEEKKRAKRLLKKMRPKVRNRIKPIMKFVLGMTRDKLKWLVEHKNNISLADFETYIDLDKNKFKVLPEPNKDGTNTYTNEQRIKEFQKQLILRDNPKINSDEMETKLQELNGKMLGAEGRRLARLEKINKESD